MGRSVPERALVLAALLMVVLGRGRWSADDSEERWAVIVDEELPIATAMIEGWRVAGHAHPKLSRTHLILARQRGSALREELHPLRWHAKELPNYPAGVKHAELLVARERHHRDIVAVVEGATQEPLWDRQWHLHNFTFPDKEKIVSSAQISAAEAWLSGATDCVSGKGVHVAVVDDGLQYTHPDLESQFDASGSYDFFADKKSVLPGSKSDNHGTRIAGTIGAGINGACGVGVAPEVKLSGVLLLGSGPVTDEQEAYALSYRDQYNDIYSNSWGPANFGGNLEAPGILTRAVLSQAVKSGRKGRGSIYVWAAGNFRSSSDNCNFDGYANSRYVICVAALAHTGTFASYTQECASNLVTAPSRGDQTTPYGIGTTDLVTSTDPAPCYTLFGGTSAAAPVVSGVVALMLSVRPDLGWRDVPAILLHTADVVDSTSNSWQINSAGHKFSHTYGFGRVNASSAVALSRTWSLYPDELEIISPTVSMRGGSSILAERNSTVLMPNSINVERVAVDFSVTVKSRGKLLIKLCSPGGTVSYLSPSHPDSHANISSWTFTSVAHWDESSAGEWTLSLEPVDRNGLWEGAQWTLHLYGHVSL